MNNLETKYKKILNVLKENVEKENFSLKKKKTYDDRLGNHSA